MFNILKDYEKLVKRFNDVMDSIGCEYLTINTHLSELDSKRDYYNLEDGISIAWLKNEAKYWLSCYYEDGHCRAEDRYESPESYKIWKSETGKLKRLIAFLEKYDDIIIAK